MSDDDDPPKTYSVAVRLRRTTVEEVHVRVPVTDDVVTDGHLDGAKIFAAALQIGTEPQRWLRESAPTLEIHPLQTPPPDLDN